MKTLIFVGFVLFTPVSFAQAEFKGVKWLEKYRDKEGCIPLKQLLDEAKNNECPQVFEPSIRPMMVGTLNREMTKAKSKPGSELCCFNWRVYGNR